MARTITSANAVLMLAVTGVFSTPQQIQNFGPDEMFDTEAIDMVETAMSVDGVLSAGFVFVPINQNITIAASSDSNDIFEGWRSAMLAGPEVIFANGTLALTSVGKKYAMSNGVLVSYPSFSDGKKTLMPRKYGIRWESVTPAPS